MIAASVKSPAMVSRPHDTCSYAAMRTSSAPGSGPSPAAELPESARHGETKRHASRANAFDGAHGPCLAHTQNCGVRTAPPGYGRGRTSLRERGTRAGIRSRCVRLAGHEQAAVLALHGQDSEDREHPIARAADLVWRALQDHANP